MALEEMERAIRARAAASTVFVVVIERCGAVEETEGRNLRRMME